MTFEQWMHSVLGRVEAALEHYLPAPSVEPAQLHEAMRYALGGMLWREHSRKVIVIIGDDTPYSPAEDAMKITVQLTHDATLLDGIQVNTLYTKTTAGEENRITYRRIAEAGIGRFYEFNKAERHLVEMSAEKVDVKKSELPSETEKKWLTPRK